jgi:hypothetical protein
VKGGGKDGRRTACGAYVEGASVRLELSGLELMPGEQREQLVDRRRTRFYLGRADDVIVAPEACPPQFASVGVNFDLLILSTPLEETP